MVHRAQPFHVRSESEHGGCESHGDAREHFDRYGDVHPGEPFDDYYWFEHHNLHLHGYAGWITDDHGGEHFAQRYHFGDAGGDRHPGSGE